MFIRDEVAIKQFLKTYVTAFCETDIFIKDGQVSIYNDVVFNQFFADSSFTHFPVEFKFVQGNFECSYCNNLTSFHGAPPSIGQSLRCNNCDNIKNFEGSLGLVSENLECYNCANLTSFYGIPRVLNIVNANDCPKLHKIDGLSYIKELYLTNCESLEIDTHQLPKTITDLWLPYNYPNIPNLPLLKWLRIDSKINPPSSAQMRILINNQCQVFGKDNQESDDPKWLVLLNKHNLNPENLMETATEFESIFNEPFIIQSYLINNISTDIHTF